jgi:hypothetical protein
MSATTALSNSRRRRSIEKVNQFCSSLSRFCPSLMDTLAAPNKPIGSTQRSTTIAGSNGDVASESEDSVESGTSSPPVPRMDTQSLPKSSSVTTLALATAPTAKYVPMPNKEPSNGVAGQKSLLALGAAASSPMTSAVLLPVAAVSAPAAKGKANTDVSVQSFAGADSLESRLDAIKELRAVLGVCVCAALP